MKKEDIITENILETIFKNMFPKWNEDVTYPVDLVLPTYKIDIKELPVTIKKSAIKELIGDILFKTLEEEITRIKNK